MLCQQNDKNKVIYADQLESYFSKLLTHAHQTFEGYKVLYSSGGMPDIVVGVIEERGDIDDLVIHHLDKTGEAQTMTTFAQIEKGCYLAFHKRFDDLREYATTYYRNFVVFQSSFPETLNYMKMNLMQIDGFMQ